MPQIDFTDPVREHRLTGYDRISRTYDYYVSGIGDFPIDMLRYDSAWPYSESDAGMIVESYMGWRGASRLDRRTVHLSGLRQPTDGRWRSFGWRVEDRP